MNALTTGHDRETLAETWNNVGRRASRRTLVACAVAGAIGLSLLIVADSFRIVALLAIVAGAFGLEELLRRRAEDGLARDAHVLGRLTVTLRGVAIVAALGAGVLILGVIFGGSVEVMRR